MKNKIIFEKVLNLNGGDIMQEKESVEKVRFIEGHVEALVKETISCGGSKEKIIELVSIYWEKEQQRILESQKMLEKELQETKKRIIEPVEMFIKKAIKEKVCKTNAKALIVKLWNKVIAADYPEDFFQSCAFEVYCIQLIIIANNNKVSQKQLLAILEESWDRIYRIAMLPTESKAEKDFRKKVRLYTHKPNCLFWFINALDYSSAANPPFVTERIRNYKMYSWIQNNTLTNEVPKGMYWLILEEKYEPVIPVDTSVAEEILGAINYLYPLGTTQSAKPEKIASQAMKRMNKIYNRWNGSIGDDIRKLIKLIRLYAHEVEPSKQCQDAIDAIVFSEATYLDKAIARVLWEINNN